MAIFLSPFLVYYAIWSVIYRMPPSPPKVVDLLPAGQGKPYYVAFCSSLADNDFGGYPGHCYVLWSAQFPIDPNKAESAGFVPRYSKDQISSLYKAVPGLMVHNAWKGNRQNVTSLTAIVDRESFEKSRQIRDSWNPEEFQVGTRDCVTFCHLIAEGVGLKTPSGIYVYPQDFIKELKKAN